MPNTVPKSEYAAFRYDAQKVRQRERYAAKIASEEGRAVRNYKPTAGLSSEEQEKARRSRKAEADATRNAGKTPLEKDAEADRRWLARQIKAGKTELEIKEGIAKRLAGRKVKAIPYAENPEFGQF